MSFKQLFFQVKELDFKYFNWFYTFSPFEVDNKQTISKLCDNESVCSSFVCVGEMGITNETRTSRPIISSTKICTINKFKFIKDLRLERIMVHSIDNNTSFSIKSPRFLINIDNNHQFFHNMHTGDVFSWWRIRSIDEWLTCSVDSCIEENLTSSTLVIFTSRQRIIIDPIMLNQKTLFSINNGG